MKKIIVAGICFFLFSCQNKEVLLPMAGETVVADVQDHSPIYFFFKTEEKDTLIEVNRKNSISSTNWLFNIDKRLPLRLVIPEIKKLQNKKEGSVHKSETSENYFTYTDTTKKRMAFLPFTKIRYQYEKPDGNATVITFDENNLVRYKDEVFSKEQLAVFLNDSLKEVPSTVTFCFSKKLSFDKYIQDKLFLKNLVITKKGVLINHGKEYIY
ncbi:hypothetical protein EZL74_06175 [Flavobacterium silvisoli]|uniref:Lipoprotein n=1 Tax=Flavobacterium silvisoli TaxID=2529433 RepID=A0A4Q9Z3T5_9FLAO|nr:hypothetical protein [Flavobacterium silvisoli]TBX70000.1 hypothetical protein EZL74_06175 [Flavobacterium silvisoli]